ncbi:MAG: S41 family peptidase [Candidatus Kapaibacteriales bacterium]
MNKILITLIFGTALYSLRSQDSLNRIIETQSQKFKTLLETIRDNYYKDSIDFVKVSESAFSALLKELDPFSAYFSSEQYETLKETYTGSLYGIGIRLFRRMDSIIVFTVQKGSPADSVGIRTGDRLIYINHEYVIGKDITSLNSKLHCKAGDFKVVTIKRGNILLEYKLPCKELGIPSVLAKIFFPKSKAAFIKFSRFGSNTFSEFKSALDSLVKIGAKFLIVDVRGNQGGYLESAVDICKLFLQRGDTIVVVRGRKDVNKVYIVEENGQYQNLPMIILIDEASASASEIFASAMQDNNRALIVGNLSFGKGLVQKTWEFRDGSAFRLTIGEYFSPLGRSIQKSLNSKDLDETFLADLNMDLISKKNFTEMIKQFGITNRLPTYFTKKGRLILGGGGVIPDVFLRQDTTPPYLQRLKNSGFINDFVLRYFVENKLNSSSTNNLNLFSFVRDFKITDSDVLAFKKYLFDWKSLDEKKFEDEKIPILKELKSTIGYLFWGDTGYFTSFLFEDESFILKLIELQPKAKELVN